MAILRDVIISIAIAIFIVSAVDLVIRVTTQAPCQKYWSQTSEPQVGMRKSHKGRLPRRVEPRHPPAAAARLSGRG
jgi:hypothetical protein